MNWNHFSMGIYNHVVIYLQYANTLTLNFQEINPWTKVNERLHVHMVVNSIGDTWDKGERSSVVWSHSTHTGICTIVYDTTRGKQQPFRWEWHACDCFFPLRVSHGLMVAQRVRMHFKCEAFMRQGKMNEYEYLCNSVLQSEAKWTWLFKRKTMTNSGLGKEPLHSANINCINKNRILSFLARFFHLKCKSFFSNSH